MKAYAQHKAKHNKDSQNSQKPSFPIIATKNRKNADISIRQNLF